MAYSSEIQFLNNRDITYMLFYFIIIINLINAQFILFIKFNLDIVQRFPLGYPESCNLDTEHSRYQFTVIDHLYLENSGRIFWDSPDLIAYAKY